ncbi:MAG TPA: DNA/RNA non-specific endonuclease [Phycisphaerae bacterium]|nr:DNA/RNA non-specific endonuclease [Phycisphaerae bacterium]
MSLKRCLPILLLSLSLILTAFAQPRSAAPLANAPQQVLINPATSPQLLLGNPSNATSDPRNKDNFLLSKRYYALAYDSDAGIPRWVSWQLTRDYLGDAPRKREFAEDLSLPPGLTRITHKDYLESGFDRGHMCPHADRGRDIDMSYATFVMTNIIPQAPSVNQKAWAMLEDYLRDLVQKQDAHIYIIAGPAGRGGWGSKGFRTAIANGKVHVPGQCWKIALILPGGSGGPAADFQKITPASRVLAVIMPNDNSVSYSWAQYRTSVNEIENVTGLKFFDKLPPATAAALKAQIDTTDIPQQQHPTYGDENTNRPTPGE